MSVPDYYPYVSLILSRVMDDIGVNEECVMRRRRSHLLQENLLGLTYSLKGYPYTEYTFGSQSEGSTTKGLKSDTDFLYSYNDRRVIQDLKDWSKGSRNYMMIRDETTFPGYCKLQALRSDKPLPEDTLPDRYHVYDDKRRLILKNDFFSSQATGQERHGPSLQSQGFDRDKVFAFYCPTWPKDYTQWSLRREVRDWPTPQMVEYMETSGCFVVPVAHRYSERQDIEWRISTSLAERCLMFNLNITQIRCYVLLKMVTKTFIEHFVPDVISSYICKTLLFHTLESTRRDFWREQNLLACVTRVLSRLYSAVYDKKCLNYFYEEANLLQGKLDQEGTRERLLFILRKLLQSRGGFLLQIGFDDINIKMIKYCLNPLITVQYQENEHERLLNCVELNYHTCQNIAYIVRLILISTDRSVTPTDTDRDTDRDSTYRRDILRITRAYSSKGPCQHKAATMLLPFIYSHIATLETSERIRSEASPRESDFYKKSLDSDATSSRLKYASFLYCTGQFNEALSVLQHVEQRMNSVAIQLCCGTGGDWLIESFTARDQEFAVRERGKHFPSTSNVGLCVMFSRKEGLCCPFEMRFEYFRSTGEERLQRSATSDDWMDLAILDCLPFLYYLQYMAARHLGQRDLQYRALEKLIERVIDKEDLGHRETAFNVLGQCMEHEDRLDIALLCYLMSLKHQPRNNAVRWHFARLMLNRR